MGVAAIIFIYSFYCFIRMILSIFRHDAGSFVYGDYHSEYRSAQRGTTIKWFLKSIMAFFLAGMIGFLFPY